MHRSLYFITHPDVVIDPTVLVDEWPLSPRGIDRMRCLAEALWLPRVAVLACSTERKARDGAGVLAARLELEPMVRADLAENDRSATGYLPEDEFQTTVDRFFAEPDTAVRGWAPARQEQSRIVAALESVIAESADSGDIAIVAHGAVGALSLAHYLRRPISREFGQPGRTGGHYYRLALDGRTIVHGWRPIDP